MTESYYLKKARLKTIELSENVVITEIVPNEKLRYLVRSIFFLDLTNDFANYYLTQNKLHFGESLERLIPQLTSDIIIQSTNSFYMVNPTNGEETFLPTTFLSPITHMPILLKRNQKVKIIGIRLWPWVHFRPKSGHLMTDHIEINLLTSSVIGYTVDQLFELPLEDAQYIIETQFERFCINNPYTQDSLIKEIICEIINLKGVVQLDIILKKYDYTIRRIEQRFHKLLGISPKLFARIIKFHNFFVELQKNKNKNLTQLVYDCGYFDQAHFIKNFQEFTGTSPSQFFKEFNVISYSMMKKNSFSLDVLNV